MAWGRKKKSDDIKDGTRSVTGTIGNAVGGVTRTSGNVVGATGRGLGDTINKTTGTHKGGNGLRDMTDGVDSGVNRFSNGIERGSHGKNPRSPWSRFKSRTKA